VQDGSETTSRPPPKAARRTLDKYKLPESKAAAATKERATKKRATKKRATKKRK
jgi:hypothetical protein